MLTTPTYRERGKLPASTWGRDTMQHQRQKPRHEIISNKNHGLWSAYSPSTATSSRVYIGTCLKKQVYNSCVLNSSNDIRRGNMDTGQTKYKLAAGQTKMERSMLNITYRDKNIWVWEKTKITDVIAWTSQNWSVLTGPSAKAEMDLGRARQQLGYEIINGHSLSCAPLRNPPKGKYLEEGRRDVGETN